MSYVQRATRLLFELQERIDIRKKNSPPSLVSGSYRVVSFQLYTSYILRTLNFRRTAV